MPAPAAAFIQTQLKAALLAKGFTKKTYVNGAIVSDPTALPDKLQTLVEAWASGDNAFWAVWQASQAVVAVDSITSAPVLGTPPAALP
jgi:hypothetical protein